ncbi:hypothetical protein Poli38472_002182 [Pythium oligandrum]|uniref:Mediator of RNA polymerase II transcription subunit 14 n=1 Tax=Pythium oligandrum TaxID=41045 RepID=A0A8K1FHY9_PYTOL|nr:hypothetical protein Poli38472_002182 [Pythium oligandrum]|eukprot:TMW63241.1 hypothetical protein Poli38472_002182 [Pythium oligandrum]
MGDFPPPPRRNVRASELVHRAVDKSYEDFRALLLQLPTMREDERREPLLTHLLGARKRFAQLLAVLKWSVQSPLLLQCESLLEQTETYRNQVNETNDRLFFMHADLNRAKERRYDLSTAVDVLSSGSYLRFPTIAKHAASHRQLPPVDTDEAAREVDDIIRFRLIEAEIPEQFTNIHLEGGFVTCEAEGEFEIVLTIQGKEKDSMWRVISVNTALTDPRAHEVHARSASTSSLRIIKSIAPSSDHYNHLKNLVQRTMNKSEKPFVDAFKVMREFCSALALQILFAQGKLLMDGRWKNRVLVKYHRDHNVLDLCYWPKACTRKEAQALTEQQRLVMQLRDGGAKQPSQDWPAFPESSVCLRLAYDSSKLALLSTTLSPSLPPSLPGKAELWKALQVPSNMFMLSAENLLIASMRAHVSAALFSVGRMLVIDSPDENSTAQLVTGEKVRLNYTSTELKISRSDIGGLEESLRITFDIREGRFAADCKASEKNPVLQSTVRQLERVLNTHCKVEVGGGDKTYAADFSLVSGDGNSEKANEMIHSSVRKVLCEIVAHEIAQIGMSLKGIEVLRSLSLSWERYIMFRQQQGGQTEDLSISDMALFFQLTSSKESMCYLVIELDKYADIDGMNNAMDETQDTDEYIRLPCFSLLQTTGGNPSTPAGVQFIQRFPAFKEEDLHPTLRRRNDPESLLRNGKKREPSTSLTGPATKKVNTSENGVHKEAWRQGSEDASENVPHIASVLLHVINMCSERMQLQHFVNFARRRRSKIRYSGEAAASGVGTGGQVVTLTFPEKVNSDPLKILAIQGHLKHGGGFELSLQLARPPFTFVMPKHPKEHLLSDRGHHVNERGQLIFRYPPSVLVGEFLNENPLEVFMVELICVVKPLCELAVKLEKIMQAVGRYTNDVKDDGHFYVESADPFAIVLACRTKNYRGSIASGSTPDGMVTYRVTIQFKQKMGFVVNYSHKAEHPLMHFIQSALNGHSDPAQLLEALERTCIPMGILASVVESQLLCAKYYRHDPEAATKEPSAPNGVMKLGMGKKGGKGMKLGYKTKLPGEETGYYAEKSYGGDDKSFVPAELVLIPRSQTHVRLSYGDRCAVDIYFLQDRTIKMQSSSSGVRVPSCPADKGVTLDFQNFGDKLRSTLSEMASV